MSLLLRLYPGAWRERYGEEFLALLADHPPTLRGRLDICRGALDAHLHPPRRSSMSRKRSTCSFCGHSRASVRSLIGGPHGVAICDGCVALCTAGVPENGAKHCSFCGKPAKSVSALTPGQSGVAICDECITLCTRILDEEGGSGPSAPGSARRSGKGGRWRGLLPRHHQADLALP